jgi:hypothetical protein
MQESVRDGAARAVVHAVQVEKGLHALRRGPTGLEKVRLVPEKTMETLKRGICKNKPLNCFSKSRLCGTLGSGTHVAAGSEEYMYCAPGCARV